MFKTKKIQIFTVLSVVVILAIIVVSGYIPNANASTPKPTQMELTLIGDEEITITVGDKYVEPGYIATNEIGEDLNSNVVIHSTVDTEHVGKYISFMLNGLPLSSEKPPPLRWWEYVTAYVMFPHLTGDFYSESWNSNQTAEQFFDMLDWFIAHYNVDPDRIIIQGQSMGGYGCLFMAAYHPEYFAGCVPVSPYNSNVDLNKLNTMPIRCYVGHSRFGEDGRSVEFATGKLQSFIGEENVNQREVSHNEIPIIAYTEEFDADNIPDLLEWMFDQKRAVIFE